MLSKLDSYLFEFLHRGQIGRGADIFCHLLAVDTNDKSQEQVRTITSRQRESRLAFRDYQWFSETTSDSAFNIFELGNHLEAPIVVMAVPSRLTTLRGFQAEADTFAISVFVEGGPLRGASESSADSDECTGLGLVNQNHW